MLVLRSLTGAGAFGGSVMAWQFDMPSWGQIGAVIGWFGGGVTVIKLVDLVFKNNARKDTFTADLQTGLRKSLLERIEALEKADEAKTKRFEERDEIQTRRLAEKDAQINTLMVLNAEQRGMIDRLTEENINLRNRHHRFATAVQIQFEHLRAAAGLSPDDFRWPEWITQDVEGPTRDEARRRRELPAPGETP